MSVPAPDTLLRQAERGLLPLGELFQGAQTLTEAGAAQSAAHLYDTWLAHTESPVAYAVWFNLAVTRGNLGDDAGALTAYTNAMTLNPSFVEARLNLGTLYERIQRPDDALATWRGILTDVADLAAKPALHVQALNNLGRLYELRKHLPEAAEMLTRSLELDPNQPKVITHWVHLRQKLCLWPVYEPVGDVTVEQLHANTSALAMLAASADPAEQLAASRHFTDEKVGGAVQALAPQDGHAHRRIRIGYLSSDLCSHAVSILTAELYELHDRARVEVYAFSWSREDNSPLRARVVGAMDHYIRIDHMTDEEAARCILAHEIDILVDLHGLTLGSRIDILAWHPAPVQLTWLGFPGPTAIPGIDYVVADAFVLPPELEPYFTERPLRMPHTFQINDRQRAIGATPERAASGLPADDAFVFCAFNSSFKITPAMFDTWMRILARAPGSVLWIVADVDATRANLVREAEVRGVAGSRLLFAQRVAPADYLARFRLADLFLDTNPFNGGTTASDALWAGLPVLTLAGETFCARMAGSLLHAVGLPELVTHTLADYEELAVALATDRPRAAALRARLLAHRDTSALFDTPRFVRDFEDRLDTIVKRPAGVAFTDTAPEQPDEDDSAQPDALSVPQQSMLALIRPGLHSVVEVGAASLARAWRARAPNAHFTALAPATPADRDVVTIACAPDVLEDADWRQLASNQCWLFPETLERLRHPRAFLERVRREALGHVEIIACVNNAQYWLRQSQLVAGTVDEGDGGSSHAPTHRFGRAALLALLQSCGFTVRDMVAVHAQAAPAAVLDAIRALALAGGADSELAAQDALPYQYVVHAAA